MATTDANGVNSLLSEALSASFSAARSKLEELDPDYVNSASTTVRVQQAGLVHPFPDDAFRKSPKHRLGEKWELLLSGTQLMYHLANLWNYSAKRISLIDLESEDRVLEYDSAMRSWIDEGQALVEHFKTWIRQAVCLADLTPKQQRTVLHKAMTDINKYSKELSKRRVGQFHGVVEHQPIRAIAEDGMWELDIAAGHSPETLQPYLFKGQRSFMARWQRLHAQGHPDAVQRFAEIVTQAVDGLEWKI